MHVFTAADRRLAIDSRPYRMLKYIEWEPGVAKVQPRRAQGGQGTLGGNMGVPNWYKDTLGSTSFTASVVKFIQRRAGLYHDYHGLYLTVIRAHERARSAQKFCDF